MRYFVLLVILVVSCRNKNNAQSKNCQELNDKYIKSVNQYSIDRNDLKAIDSTIFYLDELIEHCQIDDYSWSYSKIQFLIENSEYIDAIETISIVESKEKTIADKYPLSGVLLIRIGEVEKGEKKLKRIYEYYKKNIDLKNHDDLTFKSLLEAYFVDKLSASKELSKNIDRNKFQKYQLDVIDHVQGLLKSESSALDILYEFFNIKKPDPKTAFVILKETHNLKTQDIVKCLREEWNRTVDHSDSKETSVILSVDGYRISVILFKYPISNSDENSFIVNHNTHILISIVDSKGKDDLETPIIANIVASVLKHHESIGVYFDESYIPKEDFLLDRE